MEKPYVVGIDIGGTNSVFGVVDARGTILYSGSIKTGKFADVNDYIAELAMTCTASSHSLVIVLAVFPRKGRDRQAEEDRENQDLQNLVTSKSLKNALRENVEQEEC